MCYGFVLAICCCVLVCSRSLAHSHSSLACSLTHSFARSLCLDLLFYLLPLISIRGCMLVVVGVVIVIVLFLLFSFYLLFFLAQMKCDQWHSRIMRIKNTQIRTNQKIATNFILRHDTLLIRVLV